MIGLMVATLTGCAPYVMSYVYLDTRSEVTYRHSPCSSGAPVGVRYERSGVVFELSLEPHGMSLLKEPYLKVRAPRNVVISMPAAIAHVTYRGDEGKSISVQLKSTPLDWQGPYVDEMRRRSPHAEYRFVFADLPPITSPGTLELPIVLVDGTPVESPVFTFERRPYAGIAPLNC